MMSITRSQTGSLLKKHKKQKVNSLIETPYAHTGVFTHLFLKWLLTAVIRQNTQV